MIRNYLAGLLGVILPCLAMAAEPLALSDLPAAAEPAAWNFQEVQAEETADGTWQLTFPRWQKGMAGESTAAFRPFGADGKRLEADWSLHRYLAFRLFNDTDEKFSVWVRVRDGGERQYVTDFSLPPRQETLCLIKIADLKNNGMDINHMIDWALWMYAPPARRELKLTELVLTDTPYSAADWQNLCETADRRLAAAAAELQQQPDSAYRQAKQAQLASWRQLLAVPDQRPEQRALIDSDALSEISSLPAAARFFAGHRQSYHILALPSTLKLRQDQFPAAEQILPQPLQLDAAGGEGESLQLLVAAGAEALPAITVSASPLRNDAGDELAPQLYRLGYVPVSKPTPAPHGFGEAGCYPDPLCPNEPFRLAPFTNQALLLTVRVPADAAPGYYQGTIQVEAGGRTETLPVALKVYPVTIPRNGQLKTCFIYRNKGNEARYYGANWTPAMEEAFIRQNLEYRFDIDRLAVGSNGVLLWDSVFTVDAAGHVSADWTSWDQAVEQWRRDGRNTFLGYFPGWIRQMADLKNPETEAQKLQLTARHLAEKGWSGDFYLYIFDEPAPDPEYVEKIREVCRWVHDQGDNLNLLLTSCHANEQAYFDDIDIFVPHATLYDTAFAEQCRQNGKQYWQYTCTGTSRTRYPDSWKLDFFGTGQRALGWWLFKYDARGYLYWGVDYWVVNPWEDAATFPNCNGDGSMFYPAPDQKSLPYPSLRAELVRDGFEDYELLHLLKQQYGGKADPEIDALLQARAIIYEPGRFNETGDRLFLTQHRKLLELLSK